MLRNTAVPHWRAIPQAVNKFWGCLDLGLRFGSVDVLLSDFRTLNASPQAGVWSAARSCTQQELGASPWCRSRRNTLIISTLLRKDIVILITSWIHFFPGSSRCLGYRLWRGSALLKMVDHLNGIEDEVWICEVL